MRKSWALTSLGERMEWYFSAVGPTITARSFTRLILAVLGIPQSLKNLVFTISPSRLTAERNSREPPISYGVVAWQFSPDPGGAKNSVWKKPCAFLTPKEDAWNCTPTWSKSTAAA